MTAILQPDFTTVGLFPLPTTAVRFANPKSLVNKIPAGQWELKPVIPPVPSLLTKIQSKLGILPETEPKYISPYDNFLLPVTAIVPIPSIHEFISGMTITGPIACMLEDPLPVLSFPDALRSLGSIMRIGISPWWAPGLFLDPFVRVTYPMPYIPPSPTSVSPSGAGPGYKTFTVNIGGYHTDRNWTDREWILKEKDVIAKYNINGRWIKPWKPGNESYPINPLQINKLVGSAITPFTFFSTNLLTSAVCEEVMLPYLKCAEHIMAYKPSEIRSMRFYYLIMIDSVFYPPYTPPAPPPPSIPIKTPYIAHMTVDAQNDLMGMFKMIASQRLCNGPCDNGQYEDMNKVPPKEGTSQLETECYREELNFDEYTEELNSIFTEHLNKQSGNPP